MQDFLSNTGLYTPFTLLENYKIGNQNYTSPKDFIGETFEYYCEKEETKRTFELELTPETKFNFKWQEKNKISPENFINGKLNYTFQVIGKCSSCKEYHIVFLLNVFSNNFISNIIDNTRNISFDEQNTFDFPKTNIYIQKVGALPQIKVLPNKIISKYFNRETNQWYFKAINSLNENYGIGSFAYFRRIVEAELINIIEDIKTLPDSDGAEIQKLLDKHNENNKISTIYENVFVYLPNSLKSLGVNPIKLLYNQTSKGLHSLKEEECLEKAKSILKLLNFVIIKINEEKSDIKNLRETIKNLQ